MIRATLAAASLAAVLGGCGSGAAGFESIAPLAGGATGPQAAQGRSIFASNCASCHTLADADADGDAGPDLDDRRPSALRVASKVQIGGGGMPSFSGRLSRAETARVAAYVAAVAGR